ncbi:MAG: DNA translocase FtsK 4TM domain-containing protein [Alphaproteobacteria bacterium]
MASRSTAATRQALLPPGVTAFVRHRLIEFVGVALMAGAGFLALALVSFDPADPSLNTATGGAPANLAGIAGAYAADAMLQAFGAAAVVLVAVPLAWGWRLVASRRLTRPGARLALGVPAVVVAAIACGALPAPDAWPLAGGLGGTVGAVLYGWLGPYAAYVGGATTVALAGFAVSVAALVPALSLSDDEWRRIGRGTGWLAALPWRGARAGQALWHGRATTAGTVAPRDRAPDPRRRIEPQLRAARARDDDAIPEPGAGSEPAARRASARKIVAPRSGRRTARQETLDLTAAGEYQLPPLSLLTLAPDHSERIADNADALTQNARLLEVVLDDFGVRGEIVKVRPGPVVTLYELEPAPGTKSSRVISLADDIARSMSAVSVRVALIPGRSVIGIELPNARRETVYLRELLSAPEYESTAAKLTLTLGKDIGGAAVMTDLARMPHLLVAGTTGSGKSVAINTMILSLVYRLPPDQCKFILIDPKMLELSAYNGIPHLLAPVVTDASKAVVALKWAVREMENRYRAMSRLGVRNIAGYNKRLAEARARGEPLKRRVQTGFDADTGEPVFEEQELPTDPLPVIVVVVDEMADLMLVAGKDVEGAIQRLAQMARAAGIHLIMATQRPSVDVITGTIKANFPTRVSFQVTSKIDSRTILGEQGAEQLLGDGDMLYMSAGGRISRVHGPFVSDAEVERVATFLKSQGEPDYLEAITEDDDDLPSLRGGGDGEDALYDQAVALVCRERRASTSFVQRHLQIGYNRAARIIERMEAEGVVSRANHVGKREVLARDIDDDRLT